MIDYFHSAPPELLLRMGVDPARLPARTEWFERAWRDHHLADDDPQRERLHIGWLLDGELVGHSSVNQIRWGEDACAHLHLWHSAARGAGLGSEFFRRSITLYFERLQLARIIVEPNAANRPPNAVVEKLGFTLVKHYRTVPGPINFEQDVARYEMTRTEWFRANPPLARNRA